MVCSTSVTDFLQATLTDTSASGKLNKLVREYNELRTGLSGSRVPTGDTNALKATLDLRVRGGLLEIDHLSTERFTLLPGAHLSPLKQQAATLLGIMFLVKAQQTTGVRLGLANRIGADRIGRTVEQAWFHVNRDDPDHPTFEDWLAMVAQSIQEPPAIGTFASVLDYIVACLSPSGRARMCQSFMHALEAFISDDDSDEGSDENIDRRGPAFERRFAELKRDCERWTARCAEQPHARDAAELKQAIALRVRVALIQVEECCAPERTAQHSLGTIESWERDGSSRISSRRARIYAI